MKTPGKKPIRLATARRRTREIEAMQADLEGSSQSKTRTLWTREFLASGKTGKATG